MKTYTPTALLISALGAALTVAGPLLPGGERVVANDPPRSGHVTDLTLTADAKVLAGTQDGQVWRLADGRWGPINAPLGRAPVTALGADRSGDPARGPIGTGAGLVNGPVGLPPLELRIGDLLPTPAGLIVATGEGLRVQQGNTWQGLYPAIYFYRLGSQTRDGIDYLHAGTVAQGVFTARASAPLDWQPNSAGLPGDSNIFAFVVTAGDRLIAGSSQGIHWQPAPMQPWRPLKVGLDHSRILSLYLAAPDEASLQRLWIGTDAGLYRVDLAENADTVEAGAYAELVADPPDEVPFGIGGIVPYREGVLFSAGGVFQFGPLGLPGWHWVSLAGLLLILFGGWLLPGRGEQTAGPDQPSR